MKNQNYSSPMFSYVTNGFDAMKIETSWTSGIWIELGLNVKYFDYYGFLNVTVRESSLKMGTMDAEYYCKEHIEEFDLDLVDYNC